jgi:DmsE family decaheme c-type cytochrome
MLTKYRKVTWALIGLFCAALIGMAPPAMAQAATGSSNQVYSDRGSATCMKCHDTKIDGPDRSYKAATPIFETAHATKGDARSPFGQHECESCHGPSQAHVASTPPDGTKKTLPQIVFSGPHASPVAARNQVCLSCHQNGLRTNWAGSQHQNGSLACVSCHTIHVAKDPVLVKETQPEVCFSCHAQQRAESFENSHHPIREGKVVCADCHNPHGSAGPHLMKEFTVNETCYNCHADKRGPMLFEHQPVRESCLNCHTPHGSNEPRLMKERMNFMCSSCHSAVSNSSGGAFGGKHALPGDLQGTATFASALANNRQCLNCHSQIHGSNSPNGAYFFR